MKARLRSRVGRAAQRGFTLVELMVALTGGLLISVFVFMMASQGSKFYQQEARISNATIGVMNGFQRMRADIARAAFMASPNAWHEKRNPICSEMSDGEGWTPGLISLREMAGVRIVVGGSKGAATGPLEEFWEGNGLNPDQLILAGAYSSTDQFPAAEIGRPNPTGAPNVWRVYLQPNSPAMARLGYRTDGSLTPEAQEPLVRDAFDPDGSARVLRIVDRKGAHHYALIEAVDTGTVDGGNQQVPYIDLNAQIILQQEARSTDCGLQGLNVGATVNVVNFVRYSLKRLDNADDHPEFAAVYADKIPDTYEETRAELVREELDVFGGVIDGTTELVAEYAVDLKFGVSILENNGTLTEVPEGNGNIEAYAGNPRSDGARPDRIRSVHARLAVRSREADRDANINAQEAGLPAGGLYRVGLGAEGAGPYARVRTLQADIALRNHMRVR